MSWPRRVLWALLLGALVVLSGLAAAGWLAVQDAPQVTRVADVSVGDVARAVRLLRSLDPRRRAGAGLREVALSGREAELLLDQIAQRTVPAATRVVPAAQQARVQASIALSGALHGRWLNIDMRLRETAEWPAIDALQVGGLAVPGWLAEAALPWLLAQQLGADEWRLARDLVQGVAFAPDKLIVRYVWHAGIASRLLATLVPGAEQERLQVYVERLAGLKLKSVAGGRIPMVQLLQPLFALAQQRSAAAGADAAQENRSALLALAFAPFPRQLVTVVPAARRWRLPPRWRLTLQGREDFPLHFAISAALAVEGGGPLSDAIGVFKESLDAGDGSGFSFNDIAADRAGSRFGQLAMRSPQRLQQAMAAGVVDADLLPDVSDLPEFIRPAEFMQRYGGIGGEAYRQQLADIEGRLRALPLYATP